VKPSPSRLPARRRARAAPAGSAAAWWTKTRGPAPGAAGLPTGGCRPLVGLGRPGPGHGPGLGDEDDGHAAAGERAAARGRGAPGGGVLGEGVGQHGRVQVAAAG
jgi:hypothetical protein